MNKYTTILEFAQDRIRLLTGYIKDSRYYVIQTLESEKLSTENSLPVKKEAVEAIKILISTAQKNLNENHTSNEKLSLGPISYLVPPINFFTKEVSQDNVTISDNDLVSSTDYAYVVQKVRKSIKNDTFSVFYISPFNFTLDGEEIGNSNPFGRTAKNFEVSADVHLMDNNYMEYYNSIISSANLEIKDHIYSTFSGATYISHCIDKNESVLIEMEKDYTYISYVSYGRIQFSKILNSGYFKVLDIVSKKFNITKERADQLFLTFSFSSNPGFDYYTEENISLSELTSTFIEALRNVAYDIYNVLKENNTPNSGIVLYGYVAKIENIDVVFSKLLARDVLLFRSKVLGVRESSFENALGAIYLGSLPYQESKTEINEKQKLVLNKPNIKY